MAEQNNNPRRRQDDITLKLIADNMQLMHQDVNDLRVGVQESLKDISSALQSLVLLEERQTHQNLTQQRFEKELEQLRGDSKETDKRIDEIEKALPELKRAGNWVYSAVFAVFVAAAMFVGKMLGLV